MLFSDEKVAQFINQSFEPCWQSVRPVPIVQVDFGNGKTVTRTLNGNIATYVCSPDGQVLDILPGIYEKAVYLDRLDQLKLLASYVSQADTVSRSTADPFDPFRPATISKGVYPDAPTRSVRLAHYHRRQADVLAQNSSPVRLVEEVEYRRADFSKAGRIEIYKKVIFGPANHLENTAQPAGKSGLIGAILTFWNGSGGRMARPASAQDAHSAPGTFGKDDLLKDTEYNESIRRRQIHELLASLGTVRPQDVSKRIYKEILNVDIDDPYLGLAPVLLATDPFKD